MIRVLVSGSFGAYVPSRNTSHGWFTFWRDWSSYCTVFGPWHLGPGEPNGHADVIFERRCHEFS